MGKVKKAAYRIFLLLFYRNDVQLLTAPGKKDRNWFIIQAMTGNAFMSLVGGVFLSGLYIHMGTPDSLMGYIPMVGSIAGIILIFGGLIIERQKSRKKFVLYLNFIAKTLIISVVWVPLLFDRGIAPFIMIGLTFTGFALNALMSLAVSSWYVDAIHEGIRGRFMGVQQIFALMISATFPIIGGRYLDSAPDRYVAFCVIYSIAWLFMMMEGAAFSKINEPEFIGAGKEHLRIRDMFLKPLKNKPFMTFVGMMLFFYTAWFLSFSFAALYEIRYLEISYTFLTVTGTINPILQMMWYPVVGRMLDRYGPEFMVRTSFLLYFVQAVIYFFLTKESYPFVLILLNINASIIGPMATLGIFNLRFKVIPKEGRTIYDGFYVSAVGVTILAAPFFGNLMKNMLENNMGRLAFISYPQFRLMFLGSAFLVLGLYIFKVIKARKDNNLKEEREFASSLGMRLRRRRK
ncbi:MAG: MFS transporter [Clostridia bacterium]